MLMSVDGKISTGATDDLDFDRDLWKIPELAKGLQQYYDIEQTTDLWSFVSARTLTKIDFNKKTELRPKSPVSMIIVDNKQHFNETAIRYLSNWLQKVVIVTTNKNYETFGYENVSIIYYENEIDFQDLFAKIHRDYDAVNVTTQSGGTLNGILLREKLIDFVNVVIAPLLVGGKDVSTLIDGKSLTSLDELKDLGILELTECKVLDDSYINLRYKVIK